MYHVKLSVDPDNVGCYRQISGRAHSWGNYHFHINEEIDECDFWVVYSKGELKTSTCRCSPKNTIFITGEPDTVYPFSNRFVRQFAKVLSVQPKLRHPNMEMCHPALPWIIGKVTHRVKGKLLSVDYNFDYDDLKKGQPEKSKLISVITSNKSYTKGHVERIQFVKRLKEHYGDKLDLFGHGFKEFDDKWDVIAPYKYHICLENSCFPHYWTEKLADCYLGGAYPLYYGCPNLEEYFDVAAFKMIDIHDIEGSIRIIDEAINLDLYATRSAALSCAKKLVLDKYNLFAVLANEFDKMNPEAEKKMLTIKSDISFIDFKKVPIALERIRRRLLK